MAHEAGKGSSQRPASVSHDEWANRWDAIFGKDIVDPDVQDEEDETDTEA